jgi:hypothetical protein
LGRNWSATLRHWALAEAASSFSEGGGDEGGDDATAALAGMGERIAQEVDAAAPPAGVRHLGDGGLQTFMRVGDHELHAAQAPPAQLA